MKILVTGCAGFIGAPLTKRLLTEGHSILGIDNFLSLLYPNSERKELIVNLLQHPSFTFHDIDLASADLRPLVDGVDSVIHLAALPGLLLSWSHFEDYMINNILATQRLIDAVIHTTNPHIIFSSSSSVYGAHAVGDEAQPIAPISPYGVTKVAGEQLFQAYAESNSKFTYTILRYFSVYGPGQRPDMGYAKMCRSLIKDSEITVTGSGQQSRSNTYITDVIDATVRATEIRPHNVALNICGNDEINLLDAIETMALALERTPKIKFVEARPGDQLTTRGDWGLAHQVLGWEPSISPREGLRIQALTTLSGMQ